MADRPRAADVAERAGVSKATVSYVMNDRSHVTIPAVTRERVMRAAAELGYKPNRTAQALRTGRTNMIALWTADLHAPYGARIIHNLQLLLRDSAYELMVCDAFYTDTWKDRIDRLLQWDVDGIIWLDPSAHLAASLEDSTSSRHTPIVSMGVFYMNHTDHVGLDVYPGAYSAVQHLIDQGCRNVSYVMDDVLGKELRYQAYIDVVTKAGMEPHFITVPDRDRELAYEAMTTYLRDREHPDGIFCVNDEVAIGVHRAVRDAGLRMPDDISLVGFDGVVDTRFAEPRISTVVSPLDEMASTAWDYLQKRIADSSIPLQQKLLEPKLEVRASSSRLLNAGQVSEVSRTRR